MALPRMLVPKPGFPIAQTRARLRHSARSLCILWRSYSSEKVKTWSETTRASIAGSKFVYHPLHEETITQAGAGEDPVIRLAKLLPSVDQDELISCEIQQVKLDQGKSYEALSYCWGDDDDTKMIECNGKAFPIRSNLEQALRYLRHHSEPRVLWIDAICINQADKREKAVQVPLMRRIYSRADRTLVWLGSPGDKYDRSPSRFLRISLIIGLYALSKVFKNAGYATVTALDRKSGTTSELSPVSSRFYLDLISILQRPWFQRAWVVQEVTVSPKVTMMWNGLEYDWDNFVHALKVMTAVKFPLAFIASMRHIAAINDERVRYRNGTTSLLATLMRHKRTLATDQRDKVFSFTGLVDRSRVHVNVSYTASTATAYRDTAMAILDSYQNLDILSQPPSRFTMQVANLPSWVPDWSMRTNEEMNYTWGVGPLSLAGAESPGTEDGKSRFSAAKDTKYHFKSLPETGQLVVQGHLIDSVTATGKVFEGVRLPSGIRNYRDFSRSWMNTLRSFLRARDVIISWKTLAGVGSRRNFVTGEIMDDVFWETVCAGEYKDELVGQAARLWHRASRFPWIRFPRVPSVIDILGFPYGVYLLLRYTVFKKPLLELELQARYTLNRKMITTSNGYIGLASCQVEAGDVVVLCKGSKVPIILRRLQEDPQQWVLVGDAYIHGVMEGQAFVKEDCRDISIA